MATYTPVVDVNITINTVTLDQAGFGTMLFVDAHSKFNDRVRGFSGLSEVAAVFGTDSQTYKAARQYFSNSPSPNVIKIGRRTTQWQGSIIGFDSAVGNETSHPVTIILNDKNENAIVDLTANTEETVEDYVIRVAAAINASSAGTADLIEATAVGSALTVVPLKTGATEGEEDISFNVTLDGTTSTWTDTVLATGTAADTISAIRAYDDDWYFMATHSRDVTWVEAMAIEIQAANDTGVAGTPSVGKMYFHASGDPTIIQNDNSFFANLFNHATVLTRTVQFWHETAGNPTSVVDDVDYPECSYVGYNAVYNAGSVTWANLRTSVGAAKIEVRPIDAPVPARYLNSNEKNRLTKINCNFTELDAGANITRTGVTTGNEWIDVIRGVDWLTSEVETAIKRLLFSQQGRKVAYTNQGIAQVREVMQSVLQAAVNRGFLQSYSLIVPSLSKILSTSVGQTNWQNRVLEDVTFIGYLAGAIHTVKINGSVQAPTSATAV